MKTGLLDSRQQAAAPIVQLADVVPDESREVEAAQLVRARAFAETSAAPRA